MLAFSIDYYGIFFGATQSVELFCTYDKMEFFKNGELIELSKTEQKLLKVLCENRGKVVKREYLIDEVWQGDTEFVDAHALTVAVKRLRDKLEDDTQKPKYIKTVYGIGYTWAVNG